MIQNIKLKLSEFSLNYHDFRVYLNRIFINLVELFESFIIIRKFDYLIKLYYERIKIKTQSYIFRHYLYYYRKYVT